MKKIVNPCMCKIGNRNYRAFCKIEFEDGRLSIRGVVGPNKYGGHAGKAGKCTDDIRKGTPIDSWNAMRIKKFCSIWDEWHLNDLHPECEHQRELGWKTIAQKKVSLYHYTMNDEALKKKRDAEKAAIDALKNGVAFNPSAEQTLFAGMPYEVTLHEDIELTNYRKRKAFFGCFEEKKCLGWLKPDEHPDGILCKPCPVCGYKYGTSWNKVEVPQEVIDWLFALPDTKVAPAWV